jgi:hypothetical protein
VWPDSSCALARMAMEEVRMKAAVTSDRAISSSYTLAPSPEVKSSLSRSKNQHTSVRPSTQPLIHPLIPFPPASPPANSSIPLVSYPSTASSINSASEACSQIWIDDGVGEVGVCGYDPFSLAPPLLTLARMTYESSEHKCFTTRITLRP